MTASLRPLLGCTRLALSVNRSYWVMNVFMGFGLPVIVQAVFGQRMDAPGRTRLLIGNALFGVLLVVLRKTAMVMTSDRIFGYRDLLATTGLSRESYLGAMALEATVMALLPLAALGFCVAVGGAAPPVSWLWLPAYALAVASLFALGACLSAACRSLPSVSLATNLVTMGSFTLCPLAYPAERIPAALAPVVSWLPPSLAAESMAAGWLHATLAPALLLALLAWTLVFALASLRYFPWTDRP
ncbi:MAG TPA: ABC transporter permease [Myxococcota bacterium]|jgi:ABC-type polysaccharide/polyol phosphate export permease